MRSSKAVLYTRTCIISSLSTNSISSLLTAGHSKTLKSKIYQGFYIPVSILQLLRMHPEYIVFNTALEVKYIKSYNILWFIAYSYCFFQPIILVLLKDAPDYVLWQCCTEGILLYFQRVSKDINLEKDIFQFPHFSLISMKSCSYTL